MNNDSCSKYIKENFYPTGIVFSTDKAREIIGKNNLKPAEFLRPFGIFPKVDFKLGLFSKSIHNFRLDFYDCEDYFHATPSSYPAIIEAVLSDEKILPELPGYNLKDRKQNYKIPDNIMNRLNHYSFPWFNEYANIIVELNKFSEYELYQQPLCFIYFCSIDDPIKTVKPPINNKEKIPPLLYEKVYDSEMPVVIIIVNDKSPDTPLISEAQKTQYIENFRHEFKNHYLLYWELNDVNGDNPQNNNDPSFDSYKNDIWSKYIHRSEIKLADKTKDNKNDKKKIKGRYINLSARKRFHQMLYDFFNKYVMIELEKKLTYIDRYITENKKGLKNAIFGFLKSEQPNQSRWNNNFRMYVLSQTEFQEYLIATIFFYFQNYDQAKEICGIFMEDIKKKSIKHYNAAFELQKMCSFMASPSGKETSFEPFDQHINNKDILPACRALFFGIKASEQKANISKLPTILNKACRLLTSLNYNNINEGQNLGSVVPFIYEQTAIYYLILLPMRKRKFFATILQAGSYYLHEGKILPLIKLAFNDFIYLKEFLDSNNDDSYMLAKEYLTNSLGNISTKIYFYPGSLVFYQRYLESTIFYSKTENEEKASKTMDNLNKLFRAVVGIEDGKKKGNFLGDYNINDMSIPIIDNTSVLVIEEQDYLISKSDNMNFFANPANWSYFDKYDFVPVKKLFLCLTPPDIMALKNLDNIVLNKQNFSNFFSKRKFHINVKGKIFVRFVISNPLPFDISLSNMKLIIEFNNEHKDNPNLNEKTPKEENTNPETKNEDPLEKSKVLDYDLENKNITLLKFSTQKIELYVQVFKEGKINIKGVEFALGSCAIIRHYFNKRNKMNLYKYAKKRKKSIASNNTSANTSKRRMSVSSQSSASSKGSSRNSYQLHINYKEDIICDIIDNNNDINIIFPMGKDITLYKDQFYLMPIKIVNNSDIKIKRFCFYFNDGIHNFKSNNKNINKIIKDDLSGNCFLNEIIYKEIEIDNDKISKNNEKTIYVPLLPRKKAEIFLKILFKFEEDKTYMDNEVQRFMIRIKVKDSFNFVLKESINQFLPSLTQFQLNSICTIKNNNYLENFKLGDKIYYNETFEMKNNSENINNWQKTENKDYIVLYNKFVFDKKIGEIDYEDNSNMKGVDNDYIMKIKQEKLNKKILELEKEINFDVDKENIIDSVEQNHIKKKLCYLIAKNNIIFSWSATVKKTNNEIKGLYIHKTDLKIPTINVQFLTQLLNSSVSFDHYINKLNEENTICTLVMTINKNIFKEINDIKSFDIYINKYSEKYNWIGLKKYSFQNNFIEKENNDENHIIKLEFNCLFKEKGEYDLNQVSMCIESNILMQKAKYINKILSPVMVKID